MITIWVPKRLVEIDLYNVAARSPQALLDERQIQRIGVLVVQRAVRQKDVRTECIAQLCKARPAGTRHLTCCPVRIQHRISQRPIIGRNRAFSGAGASCNGNHLHSLHLHHTERRRAQQTVVDSHSHALLRRAAGKHRFCTACIQFTQG